MRRRYRAVSSLTFLDGIAHARLILADLSVSASGRWEGQRNGNVMYELGLAHALRPASEMILIRSDDQEINFDIAGIRIQHYDPTNLGIARERIACLVRDALRQVDQIKQLKVIEASQTLDADSLALMTREGQNESFSIPIAHTMRDVMNQMADGTKMAIRHLLSLGIVRIEVNVTASSHTYHWTQFGRAVLTRLRIRPT